MTLTPGSPSPLRPRKPPKLAMKRTKVFNHGACSGIGLRATIYAACHSSRSNIASQFIFGPVRPRRMRIWIAFPVRHMDQAGGWQRCSLFGHAFIALVQCFHLAAVFRHIKEQFDSPRPVPLYL